MRRVLLLTVLGVAFGALAGYFYWQHFGCTSGCAITSSPVNSSLYGALMGGSLFHSFRKPQTADTVDKPNS